MYQNTKIVFLLLLINMMAVSAAHSAFYKWVDKNGQVHYTQTPPPENQVQKNSNSDKIAGTPEERKLHSALIGNWVGERKKEKIYINFSFDGRFEDRTQLGQSFKYNGVGWWEVTGEMIKWMYDQGKGNWSYTRGKTKHFSVVEKISDKELVLREPDGNATTLQRVSHAESESADAENTKCEDPFDKSATDKYKWKYLVDNNCAKLASELLKSGLNPNVIENNKSILVYAIEKNRRSIVTQFLRYGVDVNQKNEIDGNTALIVAARKGNYQLVNSLINAGAKIEEYDNEKCTALIVAAKENNKNIVKRLLSVGADVNAKDGAGETALTHAKQRGHREIVKAIEDYKKLTGSK